MKIDKNKTICVLLALSFAFLSGCATPKSVVDLETKTSLNTASLSLQLQAFAANHQKIAAAREQTYAGEVTATADLQAKLDNLVAIQRIAGNTDIVALYQNILNESDLEESNHEATVNLLTETVAQVNQGVAKVAAPSKQLDSVAKGLANLASQDTLQDRANELISFYSDVASQVGKQQSAWNATVNKALTNSPPSSAISAATTKFDKTLN
jgi:hypothetical protein